MEQVKQFLTAVSQWWKRQRVARALARYSSGLGRPLSGGIALTGLLSITASLTLALTAMVGVFRRHPSFQKVLFTQLDQLLPGVINMGDGGMVTPDQLVLNTGWSVAGIIAGLVLLYTALRVMATMRTALRSMFGLHNAAENFVMGKLRDLAGFAGLALSVLLTSVLSVGARATFDWLQQHVGHWSIMPDTRLSLQAMTIAIGLLIDAVVFAFLFRGLAGARVPWPQLWRGSLLGAVGTGALRYLGTSVVASASDNPLLASVAAVATLLLWLNIAARVTLMVAAWTADPPIQPKVSADDLPHMNHTPNYVSMSATETLEWDFGLYTGLVQPLSANEDETSETNSLTLRQILKRDSGDEDDETAAGIQAGGVRAGADTRGEDAEVDDDNGHAPLIRITPESPLGRLKTKVEERRQG